MVLPQEQFSFLKDKKLSESQIGFLSHRKRVFYDDEYFIVQKIHKDWTEEHLYGVAIERQHDLKTNTTLSLMKENYCQYIPKIYGYSDEYVVFEFIHGQLIDRASTDLPPRGVEWGGLYEGNKRVPEDSFLEDAGPEKRKKWSGQIKSSITHLHNIGICHTDLTLFNVMIEEETSDVKLIDLLSCVPATKDLEKLDWRCYDSFIKPHLKP